MFRFRHHFLICFCFVLLDERAGLRGAAATPRETGSVQTFMGQHENAELLPHITAVYWPDVRSVHQPLYDFALRNQLPSPMYGSSAFCAISNFRHPLICGSVTIFGVPANSTQDTVGYIDPHELPSAAHQYGREIVTLSRSLRSELLEESCSCFLSFAFSFKASTQQAEVCSVVLRYGVSLISYTL